MEEGSPQTTCSDHLSRSGKTLNACGEPVHNVLPEFTSIRLYILPKSFHKPIKTGKDFKKRINWRANIFAKARGHTDFIIPNE
ncbi:hypothetical protein EK904_010541 [Melospiza melodia maxima]|nr:hypothetical protein EK904_010541 [Melospiza melodia maxima]